MAISEDTAALVAAQLTTAWANRAGTSNRPGASPEQDVMQVYRKFRMQVAERPGGGGGQVSVSGT